MHMADALITPAVGGIMLASTAGITAYSINRIKKEVDFESKIPLMGVVGAFVFAAQMINFTIPGTGASGHIGGGILLGAILGPFAGFLTILSILLIQCLFFGDGGLLALGCNIVNMGFFTCLIGYPLIYKKIMSKGYSKKKIFIASIASVVIASQLGAFGVVIETLASGVTELPFSIFVLFMQPIHLVIGVAEGVLTGIVLTFVWKNRSDILEKSEESKNIRTSKKKVALVFLAVALIFAGGLSLFVSSEPDGLEWSISKITGREKLETRETLNEVAAEIQDITAILTDYTLNIKEDSETIKKLGNVVAGVAGVIITLGFVITLGYATKNRKAKKEV